VEAWLVLERGYDRRLHRQRQGDGRTLDVLGGAALPVDAQRVTGVTFQKHVEVWHARRVAPGEVVEDAALGARDGDPSVRSHEARQRLRRHVVGEQPRRHRQPVLRVVELSGQIQRQLLQHAAFDLVAFLRGRILRSLEPLLEDAQLRRRLLDPRSGGSGLLSLEILQRPHHLAEHRRLPRARAQPGERVDVHRLVVVGLDADSRSTLNGGGNHRERKERSQVGWSLR
jgi:hypothetical protein